MVVARGHTFTKNLICKGAFVNGAFEDTSSCGWVFVIRFRAIWNASSIFDVGKISCFLAGKDTRKSEVLSKHQRELGTFLNTPVCGRVPVLFYMVAELHANSADVVSIFPSRTQVYASIAIIVGKSVLWAHFYACLLDF